MANASRALDEVKGGVVDLWYSDPKNSLKQNISCEYDTRFSVGFQSLNGGQQVCTIPPGAAIRDVLLVIQFSAASLAGLAASQNWALPQAWGYNAISTVSWRVGGSSEYYMSGSQLLARNLRIMKTQQQKTAMLTLGGNQVSAIPDYAVDQYAYIPLSFWKSPSVDGFEPVLASDLLGQQIQIRVTFNSPASLFAGPVTGTAAPLPPSAFSLGYFQVQQLNMYNKGQSLSEHANMRGETYVAPLRGHDQQELTAQISSGWAPRQAVTIAGIMSGQVRTVQVYLTDNADPTNAALFIAPKEVTLQYAGVNYAQYNDGTSAVWNLLDSSSPSAVPANKLVLNNAAWVTSSVQSTWAVLPFAQPTNADFEATMLVAGKPVTNGAITLFITSPDTTKNYTLHVIPTLNSAMAYSNGSANVLIG
jgi:hypothetical protein